MAEAPFIDFYELLELNPKASSDAIEQMYRIIGKRYHPEVGTQKDAEKFKMVTHAYQTLRDPSRRAAYDSLHSQINATRMISIEEPKLLRLTTRSDTAC